MSKRENHTLYKGVFGQPHPDRKERVPGTQAHLYGLELKAQCLGRSAQEKKFSVTYYRDQYERNIKRVNSPQGRYMKGKRQSTVEPVFGTLTQFMGLRKVNTLGPEQANKCMHLSAMAYNLKKYLKFTQKRIKSGAGMPAFVQTLKNAFYTLDNFGFRPPKITIATI